jgi:hypothetical protein
VFSEGDTPSETSPVFAVLRGGHPLRDLPRVEGFSKTFELSLPKLELAKVDKPSGAMI